MARDMYSPPKKKKRNLSYEKKFRAYLYRSDFETHKKIAKNLGVVPSTSATRQAFRKRKK